MKRISATAALTYLPHLIEAYEKKSPLSLTFENRDTIDINKSH
jgi:hypothetical protein